MPFYEYRCQDCRNVFGEERAMSEMVQPKCVACGSETVNRIWNAYIRAGGIQPDVGQGTTKNSASKSSCGSCSSHSCGTCH